MSRTESITVYSNVNLVADAEVREVGDKKLTSFRFADNSSSDKDTTMWVQATLGGTLGEIASELKKGDRVNVSGKVTMRVYDKADGSQGLAFEIRYPATFSINTRSAAAETVGDDTATTPTEDAPATPAKRRGRPPGSGKPKADLPY